MASRCHRRLASPRQRLLDCCRRSHLDNRIPLFQRHFYPICPTPAESGGPADCAPRRAESRGTADYLCDAVDLLWNRRTRHDASADGGLSRTVLVCATGPLEYWVFSETHSAQALERRLADELGDTASLFDQSHARFVVRISGDDATRLLAKGTPLDLEAGALPAHGASHSMIEHIPALVARCAIPVYYELSVPRSYAGSYVAWLAEAALEYGYVVDAPKR